MKPGWVLIADTSPFAETYHLGLTSAGNSQLGPGTAEAVVG